MVMRDCSNCRYSEEVKSERYGGHFCTKASVASCITFNHAEWEPKMNIQISCLTCKHNSNGRYDTIRCWHCDNHDGWEPTYAAMAKSISETLNKAQEFIKEDELKF